MADLGGGGFLRRVGDQPAWVVRGGGVGVEGVQGEVGAGVAEVVLLPPPGGHPPADFSGRQVGAGGQRVDLAGGAVPGGDPAGDLPQADRLPLARPFVYVQRDRGVGQVVFVLPAPVIGAGDGGERVGGQVGGRALAPGEQVGPGLGDVGEQGRGPAAAVKAHRHPVAFTHDLPQVWQQPAQLAGQRLGRLGDHHEYWVAVLAGDPGLLGGRGGELQPCDVHLLHVPGAVVGARVPVNVEEPQRLGACGGVAAGQRHDEVRRFAGGGELAE